MMKELAVIVFIGVFFCSMACAIHGVSVSCMMAYEEGGAPGVFTSPECSQWVFSAEKNSTRNCKFSTLQGHREYQEDRVTCNLDMKLPFSGEGGVEEVTIGIAAIFDGHGGDEASETASRKLVDYFCMHAMFTAYNRVLISNKENHSLIVESSRKTAPMIDHQQISSILEEALLRTLKEIDSEFSKEALDKRYVSGCTATIVLLVKRQFLVANIGDSKGLLCSQKGASGEVYAEELTRDHHPDREDEKARIESAGGTVSEWGVPRVNGILAVSRAIGDVYLKRYGVTAEPEITGWRPFTPENKYLVVASDGIFETLTPQNVCDLLRDKASQHSVPSLADWITRHAFRKGSTDNLSAIVISDLHHSNVGTCDRKETDSVAISHC